MGSKSSRPPPPPDYAAAARATAEGNAEAARIAVEANRVNQVTPYGNLTYSRTPGESTFDQAGYDAAMAAYNRQGGGYSGGPLGRGAPSFSGLRGLGSALFNGGAGGRGAAPNRNTFMRGGGDTWTATQTLSPDQQRLLELNNQTDIGMAELANVGLGNARGVLENPNVDFTGLPQAISGEGAQAAIMARLQPQLDRQREMMRTQLVNQGIGMGNEAYRGSFDDQNRRENDLMTAAAIRGIDIDQAARQQGISERAYQQDRPINLINALRTGTQVTSPQFVNPSQQGQTAGADIMGATNALSGYQTDMYNQRQASNNANQQGLFTLGAAAIGVF